MPHDIEWSAQGKISQIHVGEPILIRPVTVQNAKVAALQGTFSDV